MILKSVFSALFLPICLELSSADSILDVNVTQVLTFMNGIRRKVAKGEFVGLSDQIYPIANNMRQLKWNTGLASHAGTKYAYACRNDGDNENGFRFYDNRNAVDQNTIVGIYQYNQGAGKDWSEQQIVQEFLDRWASAGARYTYGSCVIKNLKDAQLYRDVIRFIQMIWGESSQVGCALKACPLKYSFACTFELGGAKLLDCINAGRSNTGCGDYRRYGNKAICMQLPYANSSKPQIDAFSSRMNMGSDKGPIFNLGTIIKNNINKNNKTKKKPKSPAGCSNPTVNMFKFGTEACSLLASYSPPDVASIDYQEFADLMTKFCSTKNLAEANADTITDMDTLRNNFCTIVGKSDYANCPASAKKEGQFDLWEEYCAALG